MTHTPGPIEIRRSHQDAGLIWLEGSTGEVVAQFYARGVDGSMDKFFNAEDNAKLYANADELLDVLSILLELPQLQGDQGWGVQPTIDRARAAIAAATEESPK